jgi:2-polyprenyl-6-methoxyphenol hydroxylase-like FAD-dependent oxidoreductase
MVERTDVVIAGGGIAGSVAAAALSGLGLDILLLEPGMHADRRVGGELLHPLGVAGLAELDLLSPVEAQGGVRIDGFHIWDTAGGDVKLAYDDAEGGPALAVDHVKLRDTLLEGALARPGISLRQGRLVALDNGDTRVRVRVATRGGAEEIECRLLIGADGAKSRVRDLAGILARRHRISSICTVTVPEAALPENRYGQLFIGGGSAALAYRYCAGQARVMFDEAGSARRGKSGALPPTVLPPTLADATGEALRRQQLQRINTFLVIVSEPRRGRVALIGDAAGTCHPLTASGMSACVADALSLRSTLARSAGDIDGMLNRHTAMRNQAQLCRLALASAMHEVMTSPSPQFAAIRAGMIRYWQTEHGSGRAMALLSMREDRPSRLFGTMLQVARHGLIGCGDTGGRLRLVPELTRLLLRYGLGLFGGPRLLPRPLGEGPSG